MKYKLLLLFVLSVTLQSFAEIKMPKIFSDNMLLQRGVPVKIWGNADAGSVVEVEFAGEKAKTKANADGKWVARLPKLSASKSPREMSIYENGKLGKKIGNILVGEVWILGGQSNMQWSAYGTTEYENFVKRANYPTIRYFKQKTLSLSKTPAYDTSADSAWIDISKGRNAGGCSAVGIYFAEKVTKELDVPVGLVFTALGASKMICWVPEEKISALPYWESEWKNFNDGMAKYDFNAAREKWKKDMAAWNIEEKKAKAEKRKPNGKRPREPMELSCLNLANQTPVYLYNAVVAPIAGYSSRGTLWYQGESDSWGDTLVNFQKQFDLLVGAWREKFENPNMYFIWAQLTSIAKGSGWALTRWNQFLSSKSLKNGNVVNIIDLGEHGDVHPRDKHIVGARFADLALDVVYGESGVYGKAPEPKRFLLKGDVAKIEYDSFGRKLVVRGEPKGLEVYSNGKWEEAKAEFKNGAIIAKSKDGSKVEGVRYLWKAWAREDAWLFNEDNLPAFSFCYPPKLTSWR